MEYDFSGWATRNNLKCSDGRIILKDAFKGNNGKTVPLVWNHLHDEPANVLGHALLENRDEGVYAFCKLNETESGKIAKVLVEHGDVLALSIYANQLKQQGPNVLHGAIRELSLVYSGANPGAYIDSVMQHDEELEDEAIIYTGEKISLYHSEDDQPPVEEESSEPPEDIQHADSEETESNDKETLADVFDTFSEKQKNVTYAMIGMALEENNTDNKESENTTEGDNTMKHNVFDPEETNPDDVLTHADVTAIFADVKRYGSLRDSVLAHGIEQIDFLFPEATLLDSPPKFIQRDMGWVSKVMGGTHKTPFSRIKSMFADITEDEARAKGYIKGNKKTEEVFGLLKRTTTPTTIYKKQKLDRDDVVDITDFDVVAWLKAEMRMMLDEEIARAVLIGDGRLSSSDDKINEQNIRPIWKDDELYTVKRIVNVSPTATTDEKARIFIQQCIRARKDYKGSGSPTLFTTEDVLTDCLLIEDLNKRIVYDSVDKLATTLRVKEIVTVPVMENLTRVDGSDTFELMGIIVNLTDYNVGADKGGAVNMFDDFDIDYNAQKYLIETRCSGALTVPFSAIAMEKKVVAPEEPVG